MKSFSILGGKGHVVELPESDNPFRNIGVSIKAELDSKVSGKLHSRGKNGWKSVDLPPGTWQIVGMLPDVTEEQAKQIVDFFTTDDDFGNEDVFRDYGDNSFFDTALESLESAILAEGYTFKNNMKKPVYLNSRYYKEYNEAQSRVLCRERCLLLRREGK